MSALTPPTSAPSAGADTWSYRPGTWFGVFGRSTSLLLPATAKDRVIELWAAVDEGAGFDRVLDALLATGLAVLDGFVLVGSGEGPAGSDDVTKILLRGAGVRASVVAAGGPDELDGGSAITWVERSVRDLTSLDIVLEASDEPGADEGSAPLRTLDEGLVRVSRVAHPAPDAEQPAAVDPADEAPADEPSPGTPAEAPVVPAPVEEAPVLDEPPVDPPATSGQPDDALTDPVGVLPVAPAGAPAAVATLLISNGDVVEVDRVLVVGRAPQARRFSAEEEPRLVTVPSPLQEISSTHIEVRPGSGPDEGRAVVTDLGSTNGTVLTQPGRGPEDLQPGVGVQLAPGATINLGDGVTISVA